MVTEVDVVLVINIACEMRCQVLYYLPNHLSDIAENEPLNATIPQPL